MQIKLAEALLRRKELNGQVERLRSINVQGMFETKGKRTRVTDEVDDVILSVPKVSMQQGTHAFDWHARALREIDAAIQQANWACEVGVKEEYMGAYVDPYVKDEK